MILDVGIIGAGISGLACQHALRLNGLNTRIFEKSRGCGGRASSRRSDTWVADLGAQFTAISDSRWKKILTNQESHLVEVQIPSDSTYSRYIHREGMSALTRALLAQPDQAERSPQKSNDIEFQSKVIRLIPEPHQRFWRIELNSGQQWSARAVVLTAPVPQAMELMQHSGLILAEESIRRLSALTFTSCLALIVELSLPLPPQIPVIWKHPSSKLAGLYNQIGKGLRRSASLPGLWVIHTSSTFAQELWNQDEDQIIAQILEAAQQAIQEALGSQIGSLAVAKASLHRWRYCEPIQVDPAPYFQIQFASPFSASPPLVLAGDAFGRPSIEGAFISGLSAGEFLCQCASLKRI